MNRTHSAGQKGAYPWAFFVAMAAALLLFFSIDALLPTLPLYIIAIGGSPADNGLASWARALASMLTRPLAGFLADRWGRKPVLVLGAVFFGGAPLLYALASSVPLLLGVRAVHGMGMAFFTTTYQAFIADLLTRERYGAGLGLASVAMVATMAVGPLFGEWMAQESGFQVLFLTLGVVGGAGVLATLALPRRGRGGHGATPSPPSGQVSLWQALRQPGVRVGALGTALLGVPFGAFIVFLPLLADARGLGGTGWVFAAYALASSLMQPLAGRIADRWGVGRTTLVGLALVGLATAGLAGVASRWMLLGLAGLMGVGSGTARVGLSVCVQGSVGTSMRGSAAAVQGTAFDLVVGFGSWGLGLLAGTTDYGVMYAAVSGITLLGLVVGGLVVGRQGDP